MDRRALGYVARGSVPGAGAVTSADLDGVADSVAGSIGVIHIKN
jgi:hypothetical protein